MIARPERSEMMCRAHPGTRAETSCSRCGDFMCSLCGPITSRALCGRCNARGAVAWEEHGDQSFGRALVATCWEAVSAPRRLGRRLSGSGRVGWALGYVAVCTFLGTLPLSLVVAALLLTVADPLTLGIRSTGVISLAVSSVLATVGVASLLPLALALWTAVLLGCARWFGIEARFELLLRSGAYGLSLVALPLLGPALLPVALLFMLSSLHATLSAQSPERPALLALICALLLFAAPFALLRAF